MAQRTVENKVTALLEVANEREGFELSLVCTDDGLLVALAGDSDAAEIVAGVTSLFSDMVQRAVRDLAFSRLDEVTLLDPRRGRIIIRPILVPSSVEGEPPRAFFLVVRAKATLVWRRATTELSANLHTLLQSLVL